MINWTKYLKDRLQGKNLDKGGNPKRRSLRWRKVRKEFLKEHSECACCGSRTKLEVHHIIGFAIDSELELDKNNLITLCDGSGRKGMKSCHRAWGHYGNWKNYNFRVKEETEEMRKKFGID